ncbi:metal-sensitive transcriptional regulator [Clostridium sp. NSJ-49]|uniref:Copper-sensitive operon repressor n=1 Tax=Clostridium disporicum TaxID=84024 RepID=A0A174KUZ6_9CLOT|nr:MULTISPECIES: metal-sensitive transcriptional regulator [Clostridium]MBC5625883.1 metal-sensitive transcriptional regulator [Clostridium sp. NSJ-49]MCD2500332.1 metal-sensitive transcriptional regulator [Clostridium sp. NSJ-145]MDU6341010.1 metal-sensitive transcriptional regulator [Clostridium sp.]CUP15863.1 Copper-sensitive operon repressor [Clostridium disporicum]
MDSNDKLNKDIINRLKRIEGQVKGIQGMVEKNVCCDDILIQVSAVRSAINKVGGLLIESYANNCLQLDEESKEYESIKKLIKNINTFIK